MTARPSDLADEVENFAKALESKGYLINVRAALDARICCDGQMCGCQGAHVGEYLAWEVRNMLERLKP